MRLQTAKVIAKAIVGLPIYLGARLLQEIGGPLGWGGVLLPSATETQLALIVDRARNRQRQAETEESADGTDLGPWARREIRLEQLLARVGLAPPVLAEVGHRYMLRQWALGLGICLGLWGVGPAWPTHPVAFLMAALALGMAGLLLLTTNWIAFHAGYRVSRILSR